MRSLFVIKPALWLGLITVALALFSLPAMAQVNFAPTGDSTQAASPDAAQPVNPTGESGMMITDPYSMMANKAYTGKLISLDFQNADIHNILRLIGEVSGKNVVVSDQVSGKVTLKLNKVPWDQALDTVLASKNLGVMENGNILRIDTIEAIRRATPDVNDPATRVPMVKKIFTPKYASVAVLAGELEKGKSMRGNVRVIGNDIYVEDDISTMQAISEIFRRNDRESKQILIEARIVEASAAFVQEYGVSWGTGYDNRGNSSNPNYSGPTLSPGEVYGAAELVSGTQALQISGGYLNKVGTLALNAQLNLSESLGHTKNISSPRIMASNDQEVYIKQGLEIPYTSGSTANVAGTTEFKEAVMELRVTPHIEENGQIITLDVTLTKDSVGDQVGDDMSIRTNEARTKLMVKDGETVVIGGIVTDDQFNSSQRVPGLHNIPLLGWFFQNRHIQNNKNEMLIFLTANIIPITVN
ncbi:MAG: type IV pilus secretin PilQ [Deltaproteobacteria bacterium]|jgi:type IV pilus assembly protein PilQ|nr:type IV pilus secretin PilQ [Deltaproteobacteria bacterium]